MAHASQCATPGRSQTLAAACRQAVALVPCSGRMSGHTLPDGAGLGDLPPLVGGEGLGGLLVPPGGDAAGGLGLLSPLSAGSHWWYHLLTGLHSHPLMHASHDAAPLAPPHCSHLPHVAGPCTPRLDSHACADRTCEVPQACTCPAVALLRHMRSICATHNTSHSRSNIQAAQASVRAVLHPHQRLAHCAHLARGRRARRRALLATGRRWRRGRRRGRRLWRWRRRALLAGPGIAAVRLALVVPLVDGRTRVAGGAGVACGAAIGAAALLKRRARACGALASGDAAHRRSAEEHRHHGGDGPWRRHGSVPEACPRCQRLLSPSSSVPAPHVSGFD